MKEISNLSVSVFGHITKSTYTLYGSVTLFVMNKLVWSSSILPNRHTFM